MAVRRKSEHPDSHAHLRFCPACETNRKGFQSMLYGRGAVLSYQYQRRSDAAAARLPAAPAAPATTGREDAAMLLRLCIVALLAISAAAAVITFAQ
jgi:hypothetical protein